MKKGYLKLAKPLLWSAMLLTVSGTVLQSHTTVIEATTNDADFTNQTLTLRDNYRFVDFKKYELFYSEDLKYNGQTVGPSPFLASNSIGFKKGTDADSDYVMYYAFSGPDVKAGLVATDYKNTGGASMILRGDRKDLVTTRIYAKLKNEYVASADLPKYIFPLDKSRINFTNETVNIGNTAKTMATTTFKAKNDSTKYVDVLLADWGNFAYDGITSDNVLDNEGLPRYKFFDLEDNMKAAYGKTIVLEEDENGEKIPFINGLESIHLIVLTPMYSLTMKNGYYFKMKAVDVTPPTLNKAETLRAMGLDEHGNFKLGDGLNSVLDKISTDNIVATDDVTPLERVENAQLIKATRNNYNTTSTKPVLTETKTIPGLKDLATIKITDSTGKVYTVEELKNFKSDIPVTFSLNITLKDEAGDLLSRSNPEKAKNYIVTEETETALSILPEIVLPDSLNEYDIDSADERQNTKSNLVDEIKRLNPNNTALNNLPDTAFEIDNSGKLTIRYSDKVVDASVNDAVVVNKLQKAALKTAVDDLHNVMGSENYVDADPALKQAYDEAIARAQEILNSRTATQEEIDSALRQVESAKDSLNGTATNADKLNKIAELERVAQDKRQEIANNPQLTADEKTALTQEVDNALIQARDAVLNATSDQVESVTQEGISRIQAIGKVEDARHSAISEIERAANDAIDAINNSNLTQEEKNSAIDRINQIKNEKIDAINVSDNVDTIGVLTDQAKQEIATVLTKTEALAELKQAKDRKLQEIQSSKLTDVEKAKLIKKLEDVYATGVNNINNATTQENVSKALKDGKVEIDKISTKGNALLPQTGNQVFDTTAPAILVLLSIVLAYFGIGKNKKENN